jgi:hypothetical protein
LSHFHGRLEMAIVMVVLTPGQPVIMIPTIR